MSESLPENDGELIEDFYENEDSSDQFDISAIGEAYANQKTYPSINPYTGQPDTSGVTPYSGQPDTSGVTPYSGQPDTSGVTPVNNDTVADQNRVIDTADRTPQQYTVDTSQNAGTPGSPIVNPTIVEEPPLPRTRTVTTTSYYDMEITDYSPAALASLQSQGYKAIAIYDDGTEAEVPWSEVHDLSPTAQYILTDIEEMALANNQHFWTRTENPDGAGSGAFVTDDEQDAFLHSAQNNFADQGDPSETVEQTETFTSDGLTTQYDLYYEAASTDYSVKVNGYDVDSGITKNATNFVFDDAPDVDATVSVTYETQAKPWNNLLLNSYGLGLRQGITNLATFTKSAVTFFDGDGNQLSNINAYFGRDGSRIGKNDESHIQLDYHSLQLIDVEGNRYLHVSDLRDHDGKGPLFSEICVRTNADADWADYTTSHLIYFENDVALVESVTVDGTVLNSSQYRVERPDSTTFPNTVQILRSAIPSWSNSIVLISYYSTGRLLKAFSFGNRVAGSFIGGYSSSFGKDVIASGNYSHAEGESTTASGDYSHAEGYSTTASGNYSHTEGYNTTASGNYSHTEGRITTASGNYSHAEGWDTIAYGNYSHAEGLSTTASGNYSHAEGYTSSASGEASHAEGRGNLASGEHSHAEGHSTEASGKYSHAEGYDTTASGNYSHAEGYDTTASGSSSHAEGYRTTASKAYSHVEGVDSSASGEASHAEGYDTTASASYSHAEGYSTTASGTYSHAEGDSTEAYGHWSHAEGYDTTASGNRSHAEGYRTTASGDGSHAEGWETTASAHCSHASGEGTQATENNQFVIGKYNAIDGDAAFIIGNGASDSSRGNIFSVYNNSATIAGELAINGGLRWPAPKNIVCIASANSQEWSFDMGSGQGTTYSGCYWQVWSSRNNKTVLSCYNDDMRVAVPNGPLECGSRITATNGAGSWTNGFVVRDTRFPLVRSTTGLTDSAGFCISPDATSNNFAGRLFVREWDKTSSDNRILYMEVSRTINGTRKYGGFGISLDANGTVGYALSNGAALRAAIGALSTDGGTATGRITAAGLTTQAAMLQTKHTNIAATAANPSANTWGNSEFNMFGSDGYRTASFNNQKVTDGRMGLIMAVTSRNTANTGEVSNGFWLFVKRDGTCTYSITNAANFRSAIGAAASSDRRLKTNLTPLGEEAVKFINSLTAYQYDIGEDMWRRHEVGVIAQDVNAADPWHTKMAFQTEEGLDGLDDWEKMSDNSPTWKLDYIRLIPPLITTVQSQAKRIERLEKIIEQLSN